MKKDHRDKLPLIEVKELTWAEALRLLSKPLELATEVKQPAVTYPHGKEALCSRSSGHSW